MARNLAQPISSRYARQEILREIGKAGQKKIAQAHIAIVGMGALGCTVADLLCRAGVGTLTLIDKDFVEKINLHRQTLYAEADVDKPKTQQAKERLRRINSDVRIIAKNVLLDKDETAILDDADIIIDCTDNLAVRFVMNDYCLKKKKTWIYGAATGMKGFVRIMQSTPGAPCLRCFLSQTDKLDSCSEVGVLNSLTAMVGSMQASLAIRQVVSGDAPTQLYTIDAWNLSVRQLKITQKKGCMCNRTNVRKK